MTFLEKMKKVQTFRSTSDLSDVDPQKLVSGLVNEIPALAKKNIRQSFVETIPIGEFQRGLKAVFSRMGKEDVSGDLVRQMCKVFDVMPGHRINLFELANILPMLCDVEPSFEAYIFSQIVTQPDRIMEFEFAMYLRPVVWWLMSDLQPSEMQCKKIAMEASRRIVASVNSFFKAPAKEFMLNSHWAEWSKQNHGEKNFVVVTLLECINAEVGSGQPVSLVN